MRFRVRYVGRVQGVGFRATAVALADTFAVTGWVRNELDGSVLLEAQGDEGEVEGFLGRIEQVLGRNIEAARRHPLDDVAGETRFRIAR